MSETDPTQCDETCCGATDPTARDEQSTDPYWLDGEGVLDAPLPTDLQRSLAAFGGGDSVETLRGWARLLREVTDTDSVTTEVLCHAGGETPHWGDVDGERYHFECFYDAVVLAAIEDSPVDVRTVSPDGVVIEARATGDTLTVEPEEAVFSLGIAADAGAQSNGDPTLADAYAAICPYVKAFPDRGAYERWAQRVPAATVATPLADATDFASALLDPAV